MASIGDVFLRMLADDKGFAADVERKAGAAGAKAGQTLGQRLRAQLSPTKIGAAIGAVFGTLGSMALKFGAQVDEAYDTIRIGTGATGEALKGLEGDFRAVAGSVRDDLGLVGTVIADLNTRTGQTGEGLRSLAKTILDLSRITKTDASANVAAATRLFGDWSIATEDQSKTLDKLFRVSQSTGVGITNLMETVVQFGSPLRLLGLGFEESIALIGKWEKEGVNLETAMAGLKFSVKTLAKEGVKAADMGEAFRRKLDAIKASADPVGESIKLFGLRAGPDLAAAILEGRFAVEDLVDVINNGGDTIAGVTAETEDFGDTLAKVLNAAKVQFGDAFSFLGSIGQTLTPLLYLLPAIGTAFGALAGQITGKAIPAMRGFFEDIALGRRTGLAGVVTRSGAVLGAVFGKAFGAAQALGTAVAGALGKIPGSGAVKAAAVRAGALVGRLLSTAVGKVAIVATVAIAVTLVGDALADELKNDIAKQTREAIDEGSMEGLLAIQKKFRDRIAASGAGQIRDFLEAQLAEIDRAISSASADADSIGPAVRARLAAGAAEVRTGAEAAFRPIPEQIANAKDAGVAIIGKLPGEIADELTSRRTGIGAAIDKMVEAIDEGLTEAEEIARFRRIGSQILDDLASDIPEVRARAMEVAVMVDQGLESLGEKPFEWGGRIPADVLAGIRSAEQAAKDGGTVVVDAVNAGITDRSTILGDTIWHLGRRMAANLLGGLLYGGTTSAKTGKEDVFTPSRTTTTPFRGLAEGGAYGAFEPFVAGERGPEIIFPRVPGVVLPNDLLDTFSGATGGTVVHNHNNVNVEGLVRATNAYEILDEMRRFTEIGALGGGSRQ